MNFNEHSNILGSHAFLSPSKYHWVNYDEEKLDKTFVTALAARRGVELHDFAREAIRLGIKLPKTPNALNLYVNDAIGFRMTPEQALYYSENCYGTADTISFRRNKLRIHDLKTGVAHTSVKQLEVYAAIFCLEYRYKPVDISMEFRIYQGHEARIYQGEPEIIEHIMERIVTFNKRINQIRMEAE